MRFGENLAFVWVCLLAGLAAAPLGAQPSSPSANIPPWQRLPQAPQPVSTPGQIQNGTNVPTLVFDAETKRYDASPGELIAPFTFNLTNVWTNEIIIDRVK